MERLIEIVKTTGVEDWEERNKEAFKELFGSEGGRYPKRAKETVTLRAPLASVTFAAYIHPSNPDSGRYGGMSFVIFPVEEAPCLISMGIGTQGLAPDENILGRPGHARKVQAICRWLNKKYGQGDLVAWAKQDPVRTDLDIPDNIKRKFSHYSSVFDRYGEVLYGIFVPGRDEDAIREGLAAFLDLTFEERGFTTLSNYQAEYERIKSEYLSFLTPKVTSQEVKDLLSNRRFVILQGPPGTGKTRMARGILNEDYNENGFVIQFHSGMTYENFVGGLSPTETDEQLGFQFKPKKGHLMEAIEGAQISSSPYLLVVDEINRSDLAKVLGEAIYLFEPDSETPRNLELSYNFGGQIGKSLIIPENLHVLGTMNTADRSIAHLDVAIRRRFSFIDMWPQMSIVQSNAGELMQKAFRDIFEIFVEYAPSDALRLVPGHSYFLERDEEKALQRLRTTLVPLLEDYLTQGYVSGFAEPIRAYLQWIEGL